MSLIIVYWVWWAFCVGTAPNFTTVEHEFFLLIGSSEVHCWWLLLIVVRVLISTDLALMFYYIGCCYLLYMWFNLVFNRTVVALDAAPNPHQLLLLISHQRDWKFKAAWWENVVYQMTFGVPARMIQTIAPFSLKEASHLSAHQTRPSTLALALVAQAAILTL